MKLEQVWDSTTKTWYWRGERNSPMVEHKHLKNRINELIGLLTAQRYGNYPRLDILARQDLNAILTDYYNLIVAREEEEKLVDEAMATLPPTMAGYNRLVSGLAKEGDMRREFVNLYFKDDGHQTQYKSGMPLPLSKDNKVHDVDFTNCDFHSFCKQVTFVNCTFTDCSGSEDLPKEDVKSDGV